MVNFALVIAKKHISYLAILLALIVASGPALVSIHHLDEISVMEDSSGHDDAEDTEEDECELCEIFYTQVLDVVDQFDIVFVNPETGDHTLSLFREASRRSLNNYSLRGPPLS